LLSLISFSLPFIDWFSCQYWLLRYCFHVIAAIFIWHIFNI
jgi:hypothetical protein